MTELVPLNPAPAPKPPRRKLTVRQSTVLKVVAWGCAALAVIGGSTVFGWWLATSTVIAVAPNAEPQVVEVAAPLTAVSDVVMPDVRGLAPEVALEVLADSGVDVAIVTTRTRPAAGPSGIILQQNPVFGTPDPRTVTLVISEPASVPDLAGFSTDDAVSALIELGARVETAGFYDPDGPEDVVRSITPAPGSALPDIVTLTVSTAPSSVDLASVTRDNCSTQSTLVMNGETFTSGIQCPASTSGRTVSWQFGKTVDVLTGTLGVPDSASPGSTATVQVLADGAPLGSYVVGYGSPQEVSVRTTGALRVSFVMTSGSGSVDIGLGGFKAVGSGTALAGLPRR